MLEVNRDSVQCTRVKVNGQINVKTVNFANTKNQNSALREGWLMSLKKLLFVVMFFSGGLLKNAAADGGVPVDTSDFESFLKSYNMTVEEFQAKVGSTKMFGGSSPVSFSGEGRVKVQYHSIENDQGWMLWDRSLIQSGYEGNESMVRMGMVARAGRNTVLYSKIGFQNTMPGLRFVRESGTDGAPAQARHDKSLVNATVHEDMSAGIAIRTVPASFWLRMGNVNWVEASPFTIWKSQPRTFAWEFLPFEIEQPIARYYEYNIAKGEKAGRAAWHKKPFNGICLESINLPTNLYLDLLYGTYERYDNFEREYIDAAGDRTYTEGFPLKGIGIGDSYRHIMHARLAKMKALGDLTLGLNFNRFTYSENIFTAKDQSNNRFLNIFDIKGSLANPLTLDGTGYYKEPTVFSIDLRGPIADKKFEIHSDIAVSSVDTTFMKWSSTDSTARYSRSVSSSSFIPAFYTKFTANTALPFQLDVAAIGKGFYSPMSFVAANDAFYAFGSNLVGSGKFLSRHEASPYVQNMAGGLLSLMPKLPGYGHLKISYGQHFQLEESRDILYLPYRLNGLDFFSLFHSSYDRWGSGHLSLSTEAKDNKQTDMYRNRSGDQSYKTWANYKPYGNEAGGLYNDYLSSYECFVPYEDSVAVRRNSDSTSYRLSQVRTSSDSVTSATGFVPVSRKFTNNFEVDFSYDISDMIGYANNLFIGGYAAVNNVTTAFTPIAAGAKGESVQLWSFYMRLEPAIALSKKFYILGLFGFENWKSEKAWMSFTNQDSATVAQNLSEENKALYATGHRNLNVPIDYQDFAYGIGFDWEMLNRVGLHGRVKSMSHIDKNFKKNDWSTPVVSLEIKTWF